MAISINLFVHSDLILRSAKRVSKDGPRASWFETALTRLPP